MHHPLQTIEEEEEWIEEIFLLLLGHNTTHFLWKSDEITLKNKECKEEWIENTVFKEMEWFFLMAKRIKVLSSFVHSKMISMIQTCKSLQRFSSEINDHLKSFWGLIGNLQLDNQKRKKAQNKLTIKDVQLNLVESYKLVSFLYHIHKRIVLDRKLDDLSNRETTSLLLSQLYEMLTDTWLQEDKHGMYDVLLRLFQVSLEPYLEILENWILEGSLELDSFGEFMIQRGNISMDFYHPHFWDQCFQIAPNSVPSFLITIQTEILIAGKTEKIMQVIRKDLTSKSDEIQPEEALFIKEEKPRPFFNFFESLLEEKLSIKDSYLGEFLLENQNYSIINASQSFIEIIREPIHVLNEKHLIQPILDQFRKSSAQFLNILLGPDYLLKSHLSAMRSLFFMKEGFVFEEFSQHLFKEIINGEQWHNENHLNSRFQEICSEFPFFGMNLAHWQTIKPEMDDRISNIYLLEKIKLDYLAPWPINILLNEQASSRYNKILVFLLQIKRAKSAVDELHSDRPNNATIHKLLLLKNKLIQFVNNLQNYVVNRVLKGLWADFKESIKSASSFDEIQRLHEQYLSDVRDRCLLNAKATLVMTTIRKILGLCLQFRTAMNDCIYADPDKKPVIFDFTKLDTEFEQSTLFLVTVLKKIVSQKRLVHLEELLLRINYNNYYSKS
eukprot:TRINITY_DN520_c0_g1_i2.p1 TRINITY_DN520_c0_g1~~TRINITY_DN520_c0_g1_i2.p1  ORF type:complete len:669 (+),score=107.42 TRINITY_DN520_c0_g1_i2:155-2161(+)